ncbi:MAG: AAA family ATPase [Candidatus Lokiarchaeota archaeon]|nr:AAA family ATPase [Candidatus Lokiarchaeota archaeon]
MSLALKRVTIKGLFGYLDYDIPVDNPDHILFLHGINGTGKTTILHLIHSLSHLIDSFSRGWIDDITRVDLASFRMELEGKAMKDGAVPPGIAVTILKQGGEIDGIEVDTSGGLFEKDPGLKEKRGLRLPREDDRIARLCNFIDDHFPTRLISAQRLDDDIRDLNVEGVMRRVQDRLRGDGRQSDFLSEFKNELLNDLLQRNARIIQKPLQLLALVQFTEAESAVLHEAIRFKEGLNQTERGMDLTTFLDEKIAKALPALTADDRQSLFDSLVAKKVFDVIRDTPTTTFTFGPGGTMPPSAQAPLPTPETTGFRHLGKLKRMSEEEWGRVLAAIKDCLKEGEGKPQRGKQHIISAYLGTRRQMGLITLDPRLEREALLLLADHGVLVQKEEDRFDLGDDPAGGLGRLISWLENQPEPAEQEEGLEGEEIEDPAFPLKEMITVPNKEKTMTLSRGNWKAVIDLIEKCILNAGGVERFDNIRQYLYREHQLGGARYPPKFDLPIIATLNVNGLLLQPERRFYSLPTDYLARKQAFLARYMISPPLHVDEMPSPSDPTEGNASILDKFFEIVNNFLVGKKLVPSPIEGYLVEQKNGKLLTLDKLSSGEKNLIILFTKLLTVPSRGYEPPEGVTFLIDEPEISLHVGWQMRFIEAIKAIQASTRGRYIIATHSPQIIHNRGDLCFKLGPPDE